MANLNGYNANDYEPTAAFEPLPAGKYLAAITSSEMKATKKGDGSYLELEFTVLEGPPHGGSEYKGRKVWDRLCINHPKDITQKIARENLSAICRAVGVMQPNDSTALHNLPLVITVRCKKREDNDELTNEIKGYAAKNAATNVANNSPQQTQSNPPGPPAESPENNVPQNSANTTTAPWQR